MSHYTLSSIHITLSSINTTCYILPPLPMHTGGALNLPAVLAGAVVAFLLLTLLIVGIIVGAVLLRRKAHKKRMLSQRKAPQQKGSITKSSKAAKEEEGTEVHTYDVVCDGTSIDRGVAQYQELDTGNLDYVSEYTELRGRDLPGAGPQGQRRGAPLPEGQMNSFAFNHGCQNVNPWSAELYCT